MSSHSRHTVVLVKQYTIMLIDEASHSLKFTKMVCF